MNCQPPSTIISNPSRRGWRTRRGTSLLEMTVACTIFLGMTTVLMALLLQNRRASEKVSAHTDTSSQILLVFERVRKEMRHGRIIGISAQGALRYWVCRMADGLPLLTPMGRPDWLPGAPADSDVAELYVKKGLLWRDFQGIGQQLAPMGKDGQLQFTWNPAIHTLSLYGAVGQRDAYDTVRNNYQTFNYDVFLTNRE